MKHNYRVVRLEHEKPSADDGMAAVTLERVGDKLTFSGYLPEAMWPTLQRFYWDGGTIVIDDAVLAVLRNTPTIIGTLKPDHEGEPS